MPTPSGTLSLPRSLFRKRKIVDNKYKNKMKDEVPHLLVFYMPKKVAPITHRHTHEHRKLSFFYDDNIIEKLLMRGRMSKKRVDLNNSDIHERKLVVVED